MPLRPHRLAGKSVWVGASAAVAFLLLVVTWAAIRSQQSRRPGTIDSQPPNPLIVAYRSVGPAPLRVRLDASGSTDNVGITAYRWDFDDGLTADGPIVDHVFPAAGVFQVRLTVEDAAGLTRSTTHTVVAQAPSKDKRPPNARFTSSVTRGRLPLNVAFDGSGSSDNRGVVQYRWRFDDDSSGEGAHVTHLFTSPGRFEVRLTVTDAAGNTDEVEQTVIVDPGPPSARPIAALHVSTERIVAPGSVEFDGRSSHDDRGVIAYAWDFGDGTNGAGPVASHRYSHAGSFLARLTVTDDSGQMSRASMRVIVDAPQVVAERVLFDDRWAAGVKELPYGANVSIGPEARSGRSAFHFVPTQTNAAFQIRFDHTTLAAYDRLGLWLNSERPSDLVVRAIHIETAGEKLGPPIPVRPHLLPGAGGAFGGVWQRAAIPLASLGADRGEIGGFVLQAAEGKSLPTFSLDDIALLPPDTELPALSECTAPPPIRGFVERREGGLVADGVPFRAVGANLYYLQQELSRHVQNQEMRPLSHVRQALSAANCSGVNVIRMLAFNENPPEANDEAVIQTSPGVYREEGLRGLDLALAEASGHNIRVILTLTNNWSAYGGLPRYAAWAGVDPRQAMTDPQVRDWVVDYGRFLAQRVNTFTGVRYRDDPTILAVELANELRCQGCQEDRDATAFTAALARGIAPEWPNHLIADGGEGFDDDANLYPGLEGSYVLSGDEGSSFSAIAEIPEIDLVSYHLYPDSWNLNDDEARAYIDTHEAIARSAGKIAYLGEFGLRTGDAERGMTYESWLQRLFFTNGGAIGMVWQLVYPERPDNDGFALVPGRSLQAFGALARQSRQLVAPGLDGVSVASRRR